MNMKESIELAEENGFIRVYCGEKKRLPLFIKNGKKWIHNIQNLKKYLKFNESQLRNAQYDVDAYYKAIDQIGLLKYA